MRPTTSIVLTLTALAGCGNSIQSDGVVILPTGPLVLQEVEINDSPFDALFADNLDAASYLLIEGFVQSTPGLDVQDHHPFFALEPMVVEFYLAGDGQLADLDVAIWDEGLEDYVLFYESPHDPEEGAFAVVSAGAYFQIAVTSPFEDAFYTLEVITYPLPNSFESVAPQALTGNGADGNLFQDDFRSDPYRREEALPLESRFATGAIRPTP